ncbi:MAG: AAA family ATPase [Microthrixaceae bacterium]|nr:AAA family ATPase [Microthrixaceae bacterium]MCB1011167.1 AAA family ATPase [Microthrixaceae bacterium]MCB9387262.1 AAA family ATPase [Microthrixaceae bacterium]
MKHPDLESEQAYIDHAHECLEATRQEVAAMRGAVEGGRGGTYQNRFERDVMWDRVGTRLEQLDLGDLSLVFGRIDTEAVESHNGSEARPQEAFYIGRLAVSDENRDPVVVDWRAPVAATFYRATGVDPMGLRRRRHFATRGKRLLGIDDELFGSAADALDRGELQGHGALISALEESRSGRLSDIVGTIQAEQDRIIRSELPGVLVVQGGPGTGKTVVALHRAAYLLYTHRFPLEGQGVLVVGPNRVFLSYIEQVLPSLGEAGVEIAQLSNLVPHARIAGYDDEDTARIKGDLVMIDVLRAAIRDRERPLRETLRLPYGVQNLVLSVEDSAEIVTQARRRFRTHNSARRFVEQAFFERLAASHRNDDPPETVRERTRHETEVRAALEWMWPVLTPTELLNDFLGSPALLRSATRRHLSARDSQRLARERRTNLADAVFTHHDVPLLDEAMERLGPRPKHKEADAVRTYGHIVVDEAQDLSPMQLRMLDRRSLNGSMTIVGDIAQSTGAWAHDDWDSVLDHLPVRREPRREQLTIGYRVPGPIMELAAGVLRVAAPQLDPPTSIRHLGDPPVTLEVAAADLDRSLADLVRTELEAVESGNVAVVAPGSMLAHVDAALTSAGVDHGRATREGLGRQVTVVSPQLVKGLELDSVIVVEPSRILSEEARGPQALYVAVTRSTKRLSILHTGDLPDLLKVPGEQVAGERASGEESPEGRVSDRAGSD